VNVPAPFFKIMKALPHEHAKIIRIEGLKNHDSELELDNYLFTFSSSNYLLNN
jgi:hypothetical protein